MLKLTKRTEYGLIALLHLSGRQGEFVSSREIGEHHRMPKRVVAEVLKNLQCAGLIDSQLGQAGGYRLAQPAERVTLGEVVSVLEGPPPLTSCAGLGASKADGECDVSPTCPIRSPLQSIRQGIWNLFQSTTLASLAASSPSLELATERAAPPTP